MTFKLTIKNKTDYDGRAVRRVIRAALLHAGADGHRYVEVYYSRQRASADAEGVAVGGNREAAVMGWAWLDSNRMRIGLPNTGNCQGRRVRILSVPAAIVAHVVDHEYAHNRGLNHGEMTREIRFWSESLWNPKNGDLAERLLGITDIGRRAVQTKERVPTIDKHAAAVASLELRIAEVERLHAIRLKSLCTRLKKAQSLFRSASRRALAAMPPEGS